MSKNLIIFGTSEIAELAFYYFSHDSDYTVIAFTVDGEYLEGSEFCGLPLVDFENIEQLYPSDKYELFIALSYAKINLIRKQKYDEAKNKGYKLASYVSSKCTSLTDEIGDNCFILEDNTIQPFVKIRDNVTLWSGNHIGHHSVINSHTFIASHVVISGGVNIGEQCFIGVNATLRDHINIGDRCVLGAGTVILSDAQEEGLYITKETERSRVPSSKLRRI